MAQLIAATVQHATAITVSWYTTAVTQRLEYVFRRQRAQLSLPNSAVASSCGFATRDTWTGLDQCTLPLRGSGSLESSPVQANWMPPTEIKQYMLVLNYWHNTGGKINWMCTPHNTLVHICGPATTADVRLRAKKSHITATPWPLQLWARIITCYWQIYTTVIQSTLLDTQ